MTKPRLIPVSGPWITAKEIEYVSDAAANAWYENANVYHERFEAAFADYVGRRHAMALPSCTSALHLALLALGVGPGDEVIVPDATWIATSAPITYVGATPVFADVDARSWCIDADSLARCITARTKAAIVVNLYGNLPDMDAVETVARDAGIVVVEDAAESIGSEYRGRKAGAFGAVSAFSFHGSKTLTTGEGGMLLTSSDELYQRCQVLRDHGRHPEDKAFWNAEVGYKYKMSSLQAALGLAQIERVEELIARKREIFDWYRRRLGGVDWLTLNSEAPDVKNTYWMVTAVLDPKLGIHKEPLIEAMREAGVDCRPFFYPLSSLPAYADLPTAAEARARNAASYAVSPYAINLPSGLTMTAELVDEVSRQLESVVASLSGTRANRPLRSR